MTLTYTASEQSNPSAFVEAQSLPGSAPCSLSPLEPFGLLLCSAAPGQALAALSVEFLRGLVAQHRLVVLRGFAPLVGDALPSYCATWGELLAWNFGTVLNLVVQAEAQNYLFTNGSVPFHWDGAFAAQTPALEFFQCVQAPPPTAGGETLFCDTARIWQEASAAEKEMWARVCITYATEKVAHYGGRVTAPLVSAHPVTGETVLRYGEPPREDTADLNPFALDVEGIPPSAVPAFLEQLTTRLYDPSHCYAHAWQDGDFLIADNHALLHARAAFHAQAPRHLQRVHIL